MVTVTSTLMAMALTMVANGIAIPSVKSMGLGKRDGSGVFSLDFSVTQGPSFSKRISKRGTPDEAAFNRGISYTVQLVVGSQKEPIEVTLDSGSSDLWVVPPDVDCTPNYLRLNPNPPNCTAGGTFDSSKSSTWKDLNQTFVAMYGDGSSVYGTFGTDSVGFPDGPILSDFQFGLVSQDNAGRGILGIGLEASETSNEGFGNGTYPNFPQVLKDQGYINKVAYSIYLNEASAKSGNIVFGGYDSEKFSGSLVKLPLVSETNLSVALVSTKTAGGKTVSINGTALIDSGTTISLVPQDVIDSVTDELEGSNGNGQYSCQQPDKEFIFNFNGISIATPYSSLVLEALDDSGENLGYCTVGLVSTNPEKIILGDSFLRSAYALFDLEDMSISLAQAKYSSSTHLVAL